MRSLLFTLFISLFGTLLFSQPSNDDCGGLIDLGALPSCTDDVYTNVDATASDIGFGNSPSCFNGGTAQNDVWFSFTTTDDLIDISIQLFGVLDGPNSQTINNPQIALYRGSCEVDGLAELACFTSVNGSTELQADVLGLTPNTQYFLRINDYSATASPNWGDFRLCVDEYVPAINMGDVGETNACFGTLYDSGGPDEDYGNNENLTFTICPDQFNQCIELNLEDYQMDEFLGFFGEQLNFYAGPNTNAPLIASVTGFGNGNDFPIQATSSCVTVEFISDAFTTFSGFELTWNCTAQECDGSTADNPTVIPGVPYNQTGFSTCDGAATFAESPCSNAPFLTGPEYVFEYEAPGGFCASIQVTGASPGTGVLVLNGPPDDPSTVCVAQASSGLIGAANFETPGTYYIVVANADGCTDFNISIEEADCSLSPALVDALCNPLNGCIEDGGVPSIFQFEDGFQDMDITAGVNDGCWLGVGAEPDFIWFTIEAQADGPFGFILESADVPSDIDFSVWGPFTNEEVCENPADVINFIENNQPIRSSWAAGADPTGLADIHPVFGNPVEDEFDCGSPATPGAGGDDFVSTIDCIQGEVYVVLINDWGNEIDAGISVDWGPSEPAVLAPITPEVLGGDTTVCLGESVQILIEDNLESIEWLDETGTLSCTNCFDPVATPTETTIYRAVVDAICYTDTIGVRVVVFEVDAGEDMTVCRGEEFQIEAGANYDVGTYSWTAPSGVTLSCDDCPDPLVIANDAGTFELEVTLSTPNCVLQDQVQITILDFDAPEYTVSDDLQICEGETVNIGGDAAPGTTYSWSSIPPGFTSDEANPAVTPLETTQYFLSVENGNCPVPSLDSVLVEVAALPIIEIASDTALCQGQPLPLANMEVEENVVYEWTGPDVIEDPNVANAIAFPETAGTYTLTATRIGCVATASFDVTITEIDIEIMQEDTMQICRGTSVTLNASSAPESAVVSWTPNNGSLDTNIGNQVVATPDEPTTYYATVTVPGCVEVDSVTILVDSLPYNLAIMPSDTMICQGEIVVLQTPTYEPSDFPEIEFLWDPTRGAESPDSLLNYVVAPDTTITYQRITTSGICVDTSFSTVTVTPIIPLYINPMDTVLCEGESVQLIVTTDDPANLGALEEIMWEPEDNLTCTDCLDPIASPTSTTNYQLSADFMGCPVGASAVVNVVNLPVVSMNTDPTVCLGSSVQLNLASDPVSDYVWTSPDDPNFMSTEPELFVSPTQTTTYVLMATNPCGSIEEQITVTIVGQGMLESIEDQTICEGDLVTLTANGSAENASSETYTWTWPGNSETGQELSTNEITQNTQVTLTYTYGTSTETCGTITEQFTVTVSPAPGLLLPDPAEICFGDSIILNLDPDANTTYSWTSPDDPNFSSSDAAPQVSPNQTITYSVTAETPGCPVVEEDLTVIVVPDVTMSLPDDITICAGDPVSIAPIISPEGNYSEIFDWLVNGASASSDPVLNLNDLNATSSVQLNYTYGPNCGTVEDSMTIIVEQAAVIDSFNVFDLPSSNEVPQGTVLNFDVILAQDIAGVTYQWTADGVVITGESGPTLVYTVTNDVTIEVTITTPSGCVTTQSVSITATPPIIDVPNAFTPDNDGDNDFFNLLIEGAIDEVLEFKIYNRWGQLVYDNEDQDNGWDGTFNGKEQPSDVYIYNISVKLLDDTAETLNFRGDVTLLK
jgi:gliding motility-associated-like protein